MKMRIAMSILVLFVLSMVTGCGHPSDDGVIFKSADPNLSILFYWPPTPEVVPEEEIGVVEPVPEPAPPCELVKGNISGSGEKIFHVEGGAYYDQVKIDEATGEAFFCSEQNAIDAGFRKATR